MGEKKFIPVRPGFKYKCQMCGDCCRGINGIFLTRVEITRLKEYNVPMFYKKAVQEHEGSQLVVIIPTIATVPGDNKRDCYCLGDDKNPNLCALHDIRPMTCFRFPYSIFTFREGKPDLEMLRTILQDEELTEEEAGLYVHKLEYESMDTGLTWYHVLAAQTSADNEKTCPGIGKGGEDDEWDEQKIEAYIRRHHQIFEDHTFQVESNIRDFSIQYGKDFDKHFAPVEDMEDFFRPKQRSWTDIVNEPGSGADAEKES